MSISIKELNPKGVALSAVQTANLQRLFERINRVRSAYGRPMMVTSGVRSEADHRRIYADIAKKKGLAIVRVPMGSQHLKAAACDIADADGSLMEWCRMNVELISEIGLWIEADTNGWVHFQCVAPGSGNRFFYP